MSVVDKVRSFAETRCRDEEVVPCGFTYGDIVGYEARIRERMARKEPV
jgi:hypothetical protein